VVDDGRKRMAHHEAGHAVVAVIEGLGLRHARLAPEPEVLTNWRLDRVAWLCIEQRAKFFIAGYCADRRFAPVLASRENGENVHDFAQVLQLVDEARLEPLIKSIPDKALRATLASQSSVDEDRGLESTRTLGSVGCFHATVDRVAPPPITPREQRDPHSPRGATG
jgi:hypothetical protein